MIPINPVNRLFPRDDYADGRTPLVRFVRLFFFFSVFVYLHSMCAFVLFSRSFRSAGFDFGRSVIDAIFYNNTRAKSSMADTIPIWLIGLCRRKNGNRIRITGCKYYNMLNERRRKDFRGFGNYHKTVLYRDVSGRNTKTSRASEYYIQL